MAPSPACQLPGTEPFRIVRAAAMAGRVMISMVALLAGHMCVRCCTSESHF